MLARDVVVLELPGDLLGEVDQLHERRGEARLGALALDRRELRELLRDVGKSEARRDADALEERGDDAIVLSQESLGEVLGGDLGVARRAGGLSRLLEGFLGLVGESLEVHRQQRYDLRTLLSSISNVITIRLFVNFLLISLPRPPRIPSLEQTRVALSAWRCRVRPGS